MKIVLTGNTGFVGSKLQLSLEKIGRAVIDVDLTGGKDITVWDTIKGIKDFDFLIHLAAITYVPNSYKIPKEMYAVNILGTLNMLELCRLNNAKMIFASSYVYGNPQYLPIDEKHPTVSFNPYCQSKIIGEQLCESYHKHFNVSCIIFRPFNIYGPGQNTNFLIPLIQKQIDDHGKIQLKDPRPKRDFVHVDDVVEAYQKAIEYNDSSFEIFNIGSGESYSVKDIADTLVNFSNKIIPIEFSNEIRENEVLDTVADISKAKRLLNWQPKISFNERIKNL